jgi:2-keto-4-pentenoate hydratase/2-oxohepta-3-ene-1,7-dioic acid hydratase in catechol pathway
MKFIRYGKNSQSQPLPGFVDHEGRVRDLSGIIKEIDCESLGANRKIFPSKDPTKYPFVGKEDDLHIFPCIPRPGKLICIAFNSKIHTKEMGMDLTKEPVFFLKATSAISGARDPIVYPKVGKKVDWEGELGVVIGRKGKYIPASRALEYVIGYCCINDLSDRYWQLEHPGHQITKGKSFDSFAPIGPYLVTKDEIPDPDNLNITLKVNGLLRQNFCTDDYQHSVARCVSFLSQLFTLEPGDTISMGSGPGHAGRWNNQFLKIGDQVELEIEHLGKQQQMVVKEDRASKLS